MNRCIQIKIFFMYNCLIVILQRDFPINQKLKYNIIDNISINTVEIYYIRIKT